jgi:hypothetical protein
MELSGFVVCLSVFLATFACLLLAAMYGLPDYPFGENDKYRSKNEIFGICLLMLIFALSLISANIAWHVFAH